MTLMVKQKSSKNIIFFWSKKNFEKSFRFPKNIFSKLEKNRKFSLKISIKIFKKSWKNLEKSRFFRFFFENFYIDFQWKFSIFSSFKKIFFWKSQTFFENFLRSEKINIFWWNFFYWKGQVPNIPKTLSFDILE